MWQWLFTSLLGRCAEVVLFLKNIFLLRLILLRFNLFFVGTWARISASVPLEVALTSRAKTDLGQVVYVFLKLRGEQISTIILLLANRFNKIVVSPRSWRIFPANCFIELSDRTCIKALT